MLDREFFLRDDNRDFIFLGVAAWLARASYAVVLADARATALLARASSAVVLADARAAALL
jgi:hypothetical protein